MSVSGAFVIGGIFLVALLMAIPNLGTAIKDGWGPAQIIDANFDKFWATVYLLVVSAAIFVCCMAIMAATVRLCFGMARDHRLPCARATSQRSTRHCARPIWSCIVVAIVAAIPMLKYDGAGYIAIAATAMIYLSYFLGNAAIMWARTKGWPKVDSPFKLGRWGMLVNVLALAWGGGMLINFAWPRAASNPNPNQTLGALSLGIAWLNKIPILYTVFFFVVIIGVIYYFAAARRHPMAVVVPPETGPVVIPAESLPPRNRLARRANAEFLRNGAATANCAFEGWSAKNTSNSLFATVSLCGVEYGDDGVVEARRRVARRVLDRLLQILDADVDKRRVCILLPAEKSSQPTSVSADVFFGLRASTC